MAGLPKPRLTSLEETLGVSRVAEILGVHPRTIERRRAAGKRLRPLEAQREEKLRRIWRELVRLFTPENAVRWLTTPVPALENRPPLDLMAEDGGLDRILDTIGRMSWGLPS
ncbi:MAG: DUF2384 domain-containing protein [Acidobacteria bacterium]|nr:DUF2384 domain-containing protein [Acidobacteriota bacterium]